MLYSALIMGSCGNVEDNHCDIFGATLEIKISSTDGMLETSATDGSQTDLAEVLDGGRMYRLAVYLVSDNTVIASTVLENGDPRFRNGNNEAVVSFDNLDYSKQYILYAVANYGDYNSETHGDLRSIDNILANLRVNSSSTSYLCPITTPYPLSLKQVVTLQPGTNTISGELVRTFARLRINLRNQSSKQLKLSNLKFADRFTQSSADLFTTGGTANVSPVATSADAIVPFENNMLIDGMSSSGSVVESTIFDAYMLESNGGKYEFSIKLQYEGNTEITYKVNTTPIYQPSEIVDGGLYIIYCPNSGKYLYANGTSNVMAGSSYLSSGELNHNYVWRFSRVSNNNFRLESMGTSGYYINAPGVKNNNVPLTSNINNNNYFNISEYNYYNALLLKANSTNYYLSVSGNNAIGASSGSNRRMQLLRVETNLEAGSLTHEATIPIRIVDKITGEALPIEKISRNDFINILLNVTYNDKKGQIEFGVSDWDNLGGDITFD